MNRGRFYEENDSIDYRIYEADVESECQCICGERSIFYLFVPDSDHHSDLLNRAVYTASEIGSNDSGSDHAGACDTSYDCFD